MRKISLFLLILGTVAWIACERVDVNPNGNNDGAAIVELEDVAKLLSEISLGESQLAEVYEAVNASSDNGYDEEYMMCDLFAAPGSGVGSTTLASKSALDYEHPLRDLIREGLESRIATKTAAVQSSRTGIPTKTTRTGIPTKTTRTGIPTKPTCAQLGKVGKKSKAVDEESANLSVDEYLDALESSDIQIYWPYSENWDGVSYPVITFDPNDGSETNVGWTMGENGELVEVLVDEDLAQERPVWVVNRNDDSGHTTLEMLRKTDPDWGNGGGTIIIGRPDASAAQAVERSSSSLPPASAMAPATTASTGHKMLLLKSLTMHRNFDSWFAGASEFVVKMGSADGFNASTEAELKLFIPTVTDFVIVVRRNKRNHPVDFNAVLVSDWTDQVENCVLLVTEDDGGTQTSWKCSVTAKLKSKSYGFDIDLPYRQNDDLVWRGSLSRSFIEANNGKSGHFGDIDLVFEFLDY